MTDSLAARMWEAADTLEEASRLYGYPHPEHAPWTAETLVREAEHVEAEDDE